MSEYRYHVDGDLVPASDAAVSVRDRGFRYGDAAFETLRVYGGDLFEWKAHADRLRNTCDLLGLDPPRGDDLRDRARSTLDANDLADAYLRLSVTRGADDGGLAPPPDPDPTVVVAVRDLPRGGVGSEPAWDGPATLQTVKTRRVSSEAIPADAKTHNYLNGVLATLELRVSDADEAVMLDHEGNVAEGATSNLFLVRDEGVHTPSLDGSVLPGVTRSLVLDLAADEGIPVHEGTYAPEDVREADEAFLTSTTREVRPVGTVDGIDVGAGPVARLLARRYDRYVEKRCYDGERLDDAAGGIDRTDGVDGA